MTEPGEGDAAIGTLIVGEFPYHFRLSTGMTEHVDEVEHHDIQVILLQRAELLQQLICISLVVDFMIRERVLPSVSFHLCLNKWLFIQVLAFFFVLIYPEIREHLSNLIGHQATEDGIAGILGGCW